MELEDRDGDVRGWKGREGGKERDKGKEERK